MNANRMKGDEEGGGGRGLIILRSEMYLLEESKQMLETICLLDRQFLGLFHFALAHFALPFVSFVVFHSLFLFVRDRSLDGILPKSFRVLKINGNLEKK